MNFKDRWRFSTIGTKKKAKRKTRKFPSPCGFATCLLIEWLGYWVSSCSNRCLISLLISKMWEFCVYFGCVCIYTIDLVILHPEFLVMQSSVFLCCPIELMHMMHLLDEKTLLFDSNGINLFPCKTSWCLNRKDCLFFGASREDFIVLLKLYFFGLYGTLQRVVWIRWLILLCNTCGT